MVECGSSDGCQQQFPDVQSTVLLVIGAPLGLALLVANALLAFRSRPGSDSTTEDQLHGLLYTSYLASELLERERERAARSTADR